MTREELIQRIKDCGQSIIDNAEKICGDYKYAFAVTITCYPYENVIAQDAPRIVIEREITPEKFIDRLICKEKE